MRQRENYLTNEKKSFLDNLRCLWKISLVKIDKILSKC